MFTYTILNENQYEVVGDNYKSIFNGTEDDAIATVEKMNLDMLNSLKKPKLKQLNDYINYIKRKMEEPYDEISITSFVDKRGDYFSSLSGGSTPTVDLLSLDATGEVDTAKRDDLLIAIGRKVKAVLQLEAFGDEIRTAIKTATSKEEIDLIVIPSTKEA